MGAIIIIIASPSGHPADLFATAFRRRLEFRPWSLCWELNCWCLVWAFGSDEARGSPAKDDLVANESLMFLAATARWRVDLCFTEWLRLCRWPLYCSVLLVACCLLIVACCLLLVACGLLLPFRELVLATYLAARAIESSC